MRSGVFSLIVFLFLKSFALYAQEKRGFEITGHIDGLNNGEKVVLVHFDYAMTHSATRDDSCYVVNGGDLHFKGVVDKGNRGFFLLAFDQGGVVHRKWNPLLGRNVGGLEFDFFIGNGEKMVIRGADINKMRNANFSDELVVDGSPSYFAFCSLKPVDALFQNFITDMNHKIAKVVDSIGYDKSLVGSLIEEKNAAYESLASLVLRAKNYYTPAIPWLITDIENVLNDHPYFESTIYQGLDEATRKEETDSVLRIMAAIAIGQPLPGFSLPTPDGKIISLKDVVVKSRITLVHLWASNSIDRQKYQRDLLFEYRKYHDKGFNVIGVSADSVASEWKIRVENEKYPWVNVSDLRGNLRGGIVNDLYREGGHSVPNTTNILLDNEGKIIAWDVSGVVLQWYLEKYLGN